MEINHVGATTIINDCYNANYDSMKAAIETLAKIEGKRKIAVLGDMLELGEFSKELHEKVGKEVAKNQIDVLITIVEEAKHIAQKAQEEGMQESSIHIFENNESAITYIKNIQKEGDVILIKASNAMKFIEIVNALKQ